MVDLVLPHASISLFSTHKWSFGIKLHKDRDLSNFKRIYLSTCLFVGEIQIGVKYKNFSDL